jgi:hypothetical protein
MEIVEVVRAFEGLPQTRVLIPGARCKPTQVAYLVGTSCEDSFGELNRELGALYCQAVGADARPAQFEKLCDVEFG